MGPVDICMSSMKGFTRAMTDSPKRAKTGLDQQAITYWIQGTNSLTAADVNGTQSDSELDKKLSKVGRSNTPEVGGPRKVRKKRKNMIRSDKLNSSANERALPRDAFKNERLSSIENVAFAQTPEASFPGWPSPPQYSTIFYLL